MDLKNLVPDRISGESIYLKLVDGKLRKFWMDIDITDMGYKPVERSFFEKLYNLIVYGSWI